LLVEAAKEIWDLAVPRKTKDWGLKDWGLKDQLRDHTGKTRQKAETLARNS
jgi:hypothetical protein